jgi:hypothetical protein
MDHEQRLTNRYLGSRDGELFNPLPANGHDGGEE